MNTFKKALLTSSIGLALSFGAGQAHALIVIPPDQISIKFDFFSAECVTTAGNPNGCYGGNVGGGATYPATPVPNLPFPLPAGIAPGDGTLNETTFGVGRITSILGYPDGVPVYFSAGLGQELAIFVYGVADKEITYDQNTGDFSIKNVGCSGGGDCDDLIHMDIYQMTTAEFEGVGVWTTADRSAFDAFDGITDVGTLWAATTFTTGARGIETGFDLVQTTRSATLPTTGSGAWLADCVSGPACDFLNSNGQTNGADLFGQFTIEETTGDVLANGWQAYNNDPIIGASVSVPEPGILSLFGGGLLGMSFFRRFANRRG